jgi:hypothetical protein
VNGFGFIGSVGRTSNPSLDGDNVWFFGDQSIYPPGSPPTIVQGVYRGHDGVVDTIAMTGQPTPGAPPGYFFTKIYNRIAGANGEVVFRAESGSAPRENLLIGLYRYRNSTVERVVDSSMPPFMNANWMFDTFDYDGESVVFYGSQGVSIECGGLIEPLYDIGARQISIDRGSVALRVESVYPPTSTILCDYRGVLERIIGTGDVLFGETITGVEFGPNALSGNRIVFVAGFTNGNRGVYLATLPEPALVPCGAIGLMLCVCRCRAAVDKERRCESRDSLFVESGELTMRG